MGDTVGLDCSKRDGTRTCARTMGNADGPDKPEETKNKINITILDKINKILILVSY